MEQSLDTIINVYHRYSVIQGEPDTLSKEEVKELVNKEMPNSFKKEEKDEKAMNDMIKNLDTKEDNVLDFSEYVDLIGNILKTLHEKSHKNASSSVHGQGSSNGPNL
ncbi:protein S100-A9-like [Grammomys surdaster]|uniref:protein S100-A9-like n=1 Tax=Grammomys surdaster TaxID=491861 RepID=UPI00109F7007|nr:protein S100-A9-like [Grammomys surdaster]